MALARAALIGSMLKCDLKYIVSGTEFGQEMVRRMSYDVVFLRADILCFMLCTALNPWWTPPKISDDVAK